MSPLTDPEDKDEATRAINLYAASDWLKLIFTSHARERMAQRQIAHDLVHKTLQCGVVVGIRSEINAKGQMTHKYEVQMTDEYGHVCVITAIAGYFKLVIVSAYTDVPD